MPDRALTTITHAVRNMWRKPRNELERQWARNSAQAALREALKAGALRLWGPRICRVDVML